MKLYFPAISLHKINPKSLQPYLVKEQIRHLLFSDEGVNGMVLSDWSKLLEQNELEKELKKVRHKIFSIKTPSRKRELREEDKIIREQIIYILNNGMEYWIKWK